MALLTDRLFHEFCKTLKIEEQNANDPDRRIIEKAFRKLALLTHPDKGGDSVEFKKINDAYNRLISHVSKLEIIESEKNLSNTSVIIEISKQSIPKWLERLNVYGKPKTCNVPNTIFGGPYKMYKGRGKVTGPITLLLYEDPEDKIPKIHCRCENYMGWITEQKLPLHLHVNKDKKIMFDQWRIMNVAEFGFGSSIHVVGKSSSAAYKEWSDERIQRTTTTHINENDTNKNQERNERQRAEEVLKSRIREEEEKKQKDTKTNENKFQKENHKNKKKMSETQSWESKYDSDDDNMILKETTSVSQEFLSPTSKFPKVYSMTSNSFITPSASSTSNSSSNFEKNNESENIYSTSQEPAKRNVKVTSLTQDIVINSKRSSDHKNNSVSNTNYESKTDSEKDSYHNSNFQNSNFQDSDINKFSERKASNGFLSQERKKLKGSKVKTAFSDCDKLEIQNKNKENIGSNIESSSNNDISLFNSPSSSSPSSQNSFGVKKEIQTSIISISERQKSIPIEYHSLSHCHFEVPILAYGTSETLKTEDYICNVLQSQILTEDHFQRCKIVLSNNNRAKASFEKIAIKMCISSSLSRVKEDSITLSLAASESYNKSRKVYRDHKKKNDKVEHYNSFRSPPFVCKTPTLISYISSSLSELKTPLSRPPSSKLSTSKNSSSKEGKAMRDKEDDITRNYRRWKETHMVKYGSLADLRI